MSGVPLAELPTHAISLMNPWAWLCVQPSAADPTVPMKDIENRDWRTTRRGRIFIHASKSVSCLNEDVFKFCEEALGQGDLGKWWDILGQTPFPAFGAIIGEVEIVDVVDQSDSPWFMGKYGMALRNPIYYPEPYPYRGMPGFFLVEDAAVHGMSWSLNNPA